MLQSRRAPGSSPDLPSGSAGVLAMEKRGRTSGLRYEACAPVFIEAFSASGLGART